jgi:hypothetical protein
MAGADLRQPITDAPAPDPEARHRQNISALVRAEWRFADDTDQILSSVWALHGNELHFNRRKFYIVAGLLGYAF